MTLALRLAAPSRYPLLCLLVLSLAAVPAVHAAPAPNSFADLAARLLPAVVNISTTQTIKSDKNDSGDDNDDNDDNGGGDNGGGQANPGNSPQAQPGTPFDQFFQDYLNKHLPHNGQQESLPRHATSLGSGFIIDPSGLVVTNNHVIADADSITVTLQDGTNFKADVVGKDTKTDLALLRIKSAKPLPAIKFGDSDKIRVGDWVLAIGNPFGLGGTVTAGILSARAREIDSGPYDDFLQTDAAINRGNSGGPMFDMDGNVIGINTAIFSPSGGSVGIGFAIPSNLAKPVIDQIRQYGHPRRGWLGVNIQSVTDDIADSLGLDKPRGALIASVTDGGPAQAAGIQPGDVVLNFDGKDVDDMRHLPRIVAETPIGQTVKVTVWRKRKELVLDVKVGELKDTGPQAATASKQPAAPVGNAVKPLGLSVANLTPDLRTKFGLSGDVTGAVVTSVDASGPAADKGMRAGDVIVEVTQVEVKSASDVAQQVDAAQKSGLKSVLLLVDRQGDLRFYALKLGAN